MANSVSESGRRHTRREFLWLALAAMPAASLARDGAAGIDEFALPPVDLDFIGSGMNLTRRWEWSRTMPRHSLLLDAGSYDRLTIHHSGATTSSSASPDAVVALLEGMTDAHVERGYGDIGYHFAVDPGGRVWEGRSLAYEGAHVYAANERNVGVVLLGNFEEQDPTPDQIASMEQLATLIAERYRIRRSRIYGHRDLAQSVCPGSRLYSYTVKLREQSDEEHKT